MYPGKRLQRQEGGLWFKPRASFHEGSGESCSHHTLSFQGLRAWKDQWQLNEAGLGQGEAWSLCSRSHWTSCPGAGRGGSGRTKPPGPGVCITSARQHQPAALKQPQLRAQAPWAAVCSVKLWSKRRGGFWGKWALSQVTLAGFIEEVDSKFKMGY